MQEWNTSIHPCIHGIDPAFSLQIVKIILLTTFRVQVQVQAKKDLLPHTVMLFNANNACNARNTRKLHQRNPW